MAVPEYDGESRLDQLVGAVPHEHAVGHPAPARGESRVERLGNECGIPIPGQLAGAGQDPRLEVGRQVGGALVLVEFAGRRRGDEGVGGLRRGRRVLSGRGRSRPSGSMAACRIEAAAPAEHGVEPGREGAGPERLGEEVVRAELEDPHLVVLVALRGQHDHRDVRGGRPRAQVRQHAVAVEPGQVEVEDDDVGRRADPPGPGPARRRAPRRRCSPRAPAGPSSPGGANPRRPPAAPCASARRPGAPAAALQQLERGRSGPPPAPSASAFPDAGRRRAAPVTGRGTAGRRAADVGMERRPASP